MPRRSSDTKDVRRPSMLAEACEPRLCLTVSLSVVAGGTLDISPVSSVLPSSDYQIMQVLTTTVPGTAYGTMYKVSNTLELPWGAPDPNPFSPIANRIYAGEGFRYKSNGTGVGSTEVIPINFRNTLGTLNSSDTLEIKILSPAGAPAIVTQPLGLTSLSSNTSATLSVVASGNAPLSYQWYAGLSPDTSNPISGATSSSFTTPVLAAREQDYHYWVRVSNNISSVSSLTATIKVGNRPVADAGGPYDVFERKSVQLHGTGSDPDNGLYLVYAWDLDGDGQFGNSLGANGDERGQNPTFLAAESDGPATVNIKLRVENDHGVANIADASITIKNAVPTARLSSNGTPGQISFVEIDDSAADRANMRYSYDFNNDGEFDLQDSTLATAVVPATFKAGYLAGIPVRARLADREGRFNEYVANVNGSAVLVTSPNDLSRDFQFGQGEIRNLYSLRDAVHFVQASPAYNTIVIGTSVFLATQSVSNILYEDAPNTAFEITTSLAIYGPPTGSKSFTLNGAAASSTSRRLFHIASGASLRIENIQVKNFLMSGGDAFGGAIYNEGDLTLRRVTFLSNSAVGGFPANSARGGAIFSRGGSLNIQNSSFSLNAASVGVGTSSGGAIHADHSAVTIDDSTLTNNNAAVGRNVVVVTSAAGQSASLAMRNTIATQSVATVSDVYVGNTGGGTAPITSGSNNLIRAATGFAGGYTNADPLLGTLGLYGNSTSFFPLTPNSPALNQGIAIAGISTDQAGVARPQGLGADIGAAERLATGAAMLSAEYEDVTRQALKLTFNRDASPEVSRGSITLQNTTTGGTVAPTEGTFSFNADGTIATLVLTNLLPDGRYQGTLGATPFQFVVSAADFDHDEHVDFSDLVILAQNYGSVGKNHTTGDANYDGVVNFTDLVMLAQRYGTSLASAAAVAPHHTPKSTHFDEPPDVLA